MGSQFKGKEIFILWMNYIPSTIPHAQGFDSHLLLKYFHGKEDRWTESMGELPYIIKTFTSYFNYSKKVCHNHEV